MECIVLLESKYALRTHFHGKLQWETWRCGHYKQWCFYKYQVAFYSSAICVIRIKFNSIGDFSERTATSLATLFFLQCQHIWEEKGTVAKRKLIYIEKKWIMNFHKHWMEIFLPDHWSFWCTVYGIRIPYAHKSCLTSRLMLGASFSVLVWIENHCFTWTFPNSFQTKLTENYLCSYAPATRYTINSLVDVKYAICLMNSI